LKNALAYYNTGIAVVGSEVEGLALGASERQKGFLYFSAGLQIGRTNSLGGQFDFLRSNELQFRPPFK
jgi:hypothetical protein